MILVNDPLPEQLRREYIEIFRKPLKKILEKANKQIKKTKEHLDLNSSQGLAIIINDSLYSIHSLTTVALISSILVKLYSSIDGVVYLTLNKYTDIPGDDYARLIWVPVYSERADDSLVEFVNFLGKKWGDYLEEKLGKLDSRLEISDEDKGYNMLKKGKFINIE